MLVLLSIFNVLALGLSDLIKNRELSMLALVLATVFMALIFGFREGVLSSTDLDSYISMYEDVSSEFSEINWARIEPGFMLFMFSLSSLGASVQFFLLTMSTFLFCSISYFVQRYLKQGVVAFCLISASPSLYNFSANTVRQGLAFAFFLIFISVNGWMLRSVFMFIGVSIHFSMVFPAVIFVFSEFIARKKVGFKFFLILTFISPLFFLLDVSAFINGILSLIPGVGALGRSLEYALATQDNLTSGRIYYFAGYLFCLLVLSSLSFDFKFFNAKNDDFKSRCLFFFVCFNVMLYPVFSGVGYFFRFLNYGFALIPLIAFYYFFKVNKLPVFYYVFSALLYCFLFSFYMSSKII